MNTRPAEFRARATLLLFVLLVLVLLPCPSSASPSLKRHSLDFQQRILSYGDVWTRQEVATLMEVLEGLKRHGLAYALSIPPASRASLSRLVEKLTLLDERLSLAIGSLLGLSRSVPESLLSRVPPALLTGGNASLLVRAINRLYETGELSSVDYLALLGYVANELKMEYVEDPETLANIEKAVSEVYSVFERSARPVLPEPEQPRESAWSALLVKAPEVPGAVLALALSALVTPLVAYALLALPARFRYSELSPIRRVLLTPGTIAPVLASPEDAISAYWTAVGVLSRMVPRDLWDTHREYLAKVERRLGSGEALSALKTLSEEYERVRFAGGRGSLSRRQLAELVESIERALRA